MSAARSKRKMLAWQRYIVATQLQPGRSYYRWWTYSKWYGRASEQGRTPGQGLRDPWIVPEMYR